MMSFCPKQQEGTREPELDAFAAWMVFYQQLAHTGVTVVGQVINPSLSGKQTPQSSCALAPDSNCFLRFLFVLQGLGQFMTLFLGLFFLRNKSCGKTGSVSCVPVCSLEITGRSHRRNYFWWCYWMIALIVKSNLPLSTGIIALSRGEDVFTTIVLTNRQDSTGALHLPVPMALVPLTIENFLWKFLQKQVI